MSSSPRSNSFKLMKNLFSEFRAAVMVTLALAIVCCGIYPLAAFRIATLAVPHQANSSLIVGRDGTIRGSRVIGQHVTADKYFHPRPSAAGNGYDATSSSGSNLGPTSKKLACAITQNISDYRAQNNLDTN